MSGPAGSPPGSGPPPRLEVRGASFAYGRHEALSAVDLALRPGRVLGLIGPNGAGKSTLLRLAAGLARPSSGSVLLDGVEVSSLRPRPRARLVAYVPQSFELPFTFTVHEIVLQGRHAHMGTAVFESAGDLEIAREAMELTGVWELRGRSFDALSGGERQRAVIASALAQEPSLLVLDEPTSSLDLRFQGATVALLRRLVADRGLSVLVALHDLNLAAVLCDEIALLVGGRVAASGAPGEVLRKTLLEEAYEARLHVGQGPLGPYVLPLP